MGWVGPLFLPLSHAHSYISSNNTQHTHPPQQVGTQNGRLTALGQPDMHRHVSVIAHGAGNPQQPQPLPVRQIRPFLEGK